MSFPAGSDIVYRGDGDNDNGGGWNPARGGTRYNDQAAPVLTINDGVTTASSTTLTSTGGGFTEAMEGTIGKVISGTGVTIGKHVEIVTYVSSAEVTINEAIDTGSGSSSVEINWGGAKAVPDDEQLDHVDKRCCYPNMVGWIKKGTYSTTGHITSDIDDFRFEGFNLFPGDEPDWADMPTLNTGSSNFIFDNAVGFHFLKGTTSNSQGWRFDNGGCCYRVDLENTGSGPAFTANGVGCRFIECRGKAPSNDAFAGSGNGTTFKECVAWDSPQGFDLTKLGSTASGCIATGCTTGFRVRDPYVQILGCGAYNCTTGYDFGSEVQITVLNSFSGNCTTAFTATAEDTQTYVNFCVIWGETTRFNNVIDRGSNVFTDPGLTDPANFDFTYTGPTSSAIGAGCSIGNVIGMVGTYNRNAGVDWDDHAAGGGGGGSEGFPLGKAVN